MRAIRQHLGHRRPGQQAAVGPRVHRADTVVVRVEQIAEALVIGPIALDGATQHELLEKPAGMREVPLRRAGIGHGLDDVILILQRLAQRHGLVANPPELIGELRLHGGA